VPILMSVVFFYGAAPCQNNSQQKTDNDDQDAGLFKCHYFAPLKGPFRGHRG
jgi:hypothetical protein